MPIFAPGYRPKKSQQTFLEQERKRKRNRESEGAPPSPEAPTGIHDGRTPHAISTRDPYYVAGHPREVPLPGGNFPHAAVPETKRFGDIVKEELAQIKPSINTPDMNQDQRPVSWKQRHVNNLTNILHRCMTAGDWKRAWRAWCILIRTEVDDEYWDICLHGRWCIGAELLLKTNLEAPDESRVYLNAAGLPEPAITAHGFSEARRYYEELILHHPPEPTASDAADARTFYPALFNIWIYEVQDRSKRAKAALKFASKSATAQDSDIEGASDSIATRDIQLRELEEAQPILQRLRDVVATPPYDVEPQILSYRGQAGLWVSSLHRDLGNSFTSKVEDPDDPDVLDDPGEDVEEAARQHHSQARAERHMAKEAYRRMQSLGTRLPPDIVRLLDEDDDVET